MYIFEGPDMVAELAECRLSVWEIGKSIARRVKPVTYKIDTCRYLA